MNIQIFGTKNRHLDLFERYLITVVIPNLNYGVNDPNNGTQDGTQDGIQDDTQE